VEESKVMLELVAGENRTMIMDPITMDTFTGEWWDTRRPEIISRTQAHVEASATVNATLSGGDDGSAATSGGVA
jgi:hypothetical protein